MKHWLILLSVLSFKLSAGEPDPFKISVKNTHQIKILNHGLSSFEERLQMIERAQKTIDVEYFIYSLDKSGRIFTQALIKKAREGVKVRMLLDYVMIKGQLSPFYAHELIKEGIEVKYFNVKSTLNLFSGTYRNHRKVLLIDGKTAITGGRNIADEYFDLREDFNFIDRDIKVEGEIVQSIQATFDQVFNAKPSIVVERDKKPDIYDAVYKVGDGDTDTFRFEQDLKDWNNKIAKAINFLTESDGSNVEAIRAKGRQELALEYSGTCEDMSFNSEYPIIGKKNRSERIIKHDLSERIKNAKESIVFDSPYFIVDDESRVSLEQALEKKVNIRLLTNSLNSTDAIYVYDVFDSTIKKWIEKGIEAHIFKGVVPENYATMSEEIAKARFGVHAKSFVFDKKDVIIGTFNFDPRSSNLNTEMTVACNNNPELAKIVLDDIDGRIKSAIHLDSAETVDKVEFYNTGFFKRIGYYFLKVPANIFDYLL
ncbi:MAG: phosphatidylserine/phosphatidylglycerophosphate/cardiolipin synthase family protein [Bacteriovorax sp.]|jgi:putative cardiolipin synthase